MLKGLETSLVRESLPMGSLRVPRALIRFSIVG